ncbi:MAG: Fur family transcriptional regulator [Actinomycetota bacterium]
MNAEEASQDNRRLHGEAAIRLAALEQRYTSSRRALVETLASAGRPLTTPEILKNDASASISSIYRNLTVLCEAEVARKIPGADDVGRFELAEELGGHHHHLVCSSCGTMEDVEASPKLERAIAEAARQASEESGFQIRAHRIDFEGVCTSCLDKSTPVTRTN